MSAFGFGNTGGSSTTGPAFNFGAKTTATGFTLGTTATSAAPGSLFGSAPTFGAASSSGLAFGTPVASQPAPGLFGAPTGQTAGLAFGTAVNTVAPTSQSAGLTFGGTAPSTGLPFGTPTVGQTGGGLSFGNAAPTGQTGLAFGTPTTTATGLAFGTPVTTATGLTFGTPVTAATGLAFGTPATTAAGLAFGTPATTAGGLTYGTPVTNTAQPGSFAFGASATPGLSFGAPTTSAAPSTGLSFGTPNVTTTQTGLTFPTPTTSVGVGGTLFAAPVTSATPLVFPGLSTTVTTTTKTIGSLTSTAGFGLPAPTSTVGFGLAAPTSTAGFGLAAPTSTAGFGLAAPTSTAGFGLAAPTSTAGFGLAAPTSTAGFGLTAPATTSTGFNLGTPATSTTSGGLFFGGLGAKPLSFLPSTSVGPGPQLCLGTVPPATTSTSIGLGGVDASQTKAGLTGTSPGRADAKAVKENQIPNEILQTIESFKSFVKTQKGLSSDIARGSVKPLHKVQEDTESLKQMLAALTSGFQRNGALADKLKADTAKCLHHAEMAQRTHETPPGLQYDNVAPIEYFSELVAGFERDMQLFRQEIENTEKHILSLSQPMALTPQELALAMRRLHDSFVALAGRLQTVHNSVEMQKEQYLNLRKYFLKDSTNVFAEQAKKSIVGGLKPTNGAKMAPGPTPFSVLGSQHGFGLLPTNTTEPKPSFPSGNPLVSGWSGTQQQQQPSQLTTTQFGVGGGGGGGGGLFSSGGITGLSTLPTPQPVDNTSGFQLQKPPPGNKRGKR